MTTWLEVADQANALPPYGTLDPGGEQGPEGPPGPAGADGAPGADGADGVGVAVTSGNWTPDFHTTGGSVTLNGGANVGKWHKIGNLVVVSFFSLVSSVSSPSGELYVQGLPAATGLGPAIVEFAGSVWASGLTSDSSAHIPLQCEVRTGEAQPRIYVSGFADGSNQDIAGRIKASTVIHCTITYLV
jgi:hypothetical protein